MIRRIRLGALGLSAASLMLTVGCQNKLHDDNMALHDQNNKLQADLNDTRTRLGDTEGRLAQAPDPATVNQLQSRVNDLENQLKQSQAAAAAAPGQAAPANDPALAGIEATYDKSRGTLTVNLPGAVLFDKGKATLKPTAGKTLDKIVTAIKKDYAAKTIFVDGYTDTDPITRTKEQWEDNWDLAAARANAVRRYLTAHGVDPHKVDLRSFGPNHPKANKDASRRVEIVVQVN
ncbi:MAG TPA: OmpA family protein [Tepidisphaeraceae bacterium]|jgi:flagellar motor protein MotB